MTRDEFMHGWALLTIQPWGRYYDGREEPEKAQLQFELYYSKLSYAHPEAWRETALLFAAGSEWPSLDSVRQSLGHRNNGYVQRLPAPEPQGELDPKAQAEVEATLSRIMGKPFKLPD